MTIISRARIADALHMTSWLSFLYFSSNSQRRRDGIQFLFCPSQPEGPGEIKTDEQLLASKREVIFMRYCLCLLLAAFAFSPALAADDEPIFEPGAKLTKESGGGSLI